MPRLLCDQLHVNLSVASEAYKKARVVDDALLTAVETPVALPTSGDAPTSVRIPKSGLIASHRKSENKLGVGSKGVWGPFLTTLRKG